MFFYTSLKLVHFLLDFAIDNQLIFGDSYMFRVIIIFIAVFEVCKLKRTFCYKEIIVLQCSKNKGTVGSKFSILLLFRQLTCIKIGTVF